MRESLGICKPRGEMKVNSVGTLAGVDRREDGGSASSVRPHSRGVSRNATVAIIETH